MELWELAAREAIRDTVAAYAHYVDGGRFDKLVSLFVPNGTIEVVDGASAHGHGELRDFFTGVGDSLRSADVPRVRHHVSNLRITLEGPARARGECYFLCVTDAGVDHWGRYRDSYVAVGRDWRFEHRSVRTDGWVAGGWAARRRER
jgi:hypothetical protein